MEILIDVGLVLVGYVLGLVSVVCCVTDHDTDNTKPPRLPR